MGHLGLLQFDLYLFIIIIGGILVLFIYITNLASNEIFSPSNKIHGEVGWAKDLSAPWVFVPGGGYQCVKVNADLVLVSLKPYSLRFLHMLKLLV